MQNFTDLTLAEQPRRLRYLLACLPLLLLDAACGETRHEGGAPSGDDSSLAGGGVKAQGGSVSTGGVDQTSQAGQGGTVLQTSGTSALGGAPSVTAGAPTVYPEPPIFKSYSVTGSWPTEPVAIPTKPGKLSYSKLEIDNRFLAESCAIGDYNGDGQPDVSSGRRWYEGPAFSVAHVFRGGHEELPRAGDAPEIDTGVSDDWADYAFDVNGDGWVDIINVSNPDTADDKNPAPMPAPQTHSTASWYENPGETPSESWLVHSIHKDVRGEQHGLVDVDGDGWPELFGACKGCSPSSTKGYYQADWAHPTKPWTYHAVTKTYEFPFGGTGKLHGAGFGDINGDGQPDLLERGGAWLDVQASAPNVTACPAAGCGWVNTTLYDGDAQAVRGPAQMFAFDVDGDGDGDIVAADWAHGWGMAWYEQTEPLVFVRRQFLGSNSELDVAQFGKVFFSQPHALQVGDMDGDGVPDLVTGKMRFANPIAYGDPDSQGKPVLYVFKTVRNQPSSANGGSVSFEPMLVDEQVGVGRQIALGHLNRDGIMDLCVASKLGLYAFLGQ